MTDRPIIFSAPMVRALLDGRKTMTRRLAWRDGKPGDVAPLKPLAPFQVRSPWQKVQPGDRLWVREAAHCNQSTHPVLTFYKADSSARELKFRPSIHMPRWASRLTLIVEATKIERLQDISDDDAVAEGLWYCEEGDAAGFWFAGPDYKPDDVFGDGSVECYQRLWESLHGKDAWDANPEVVAITFRVVRENIDRVKEP